MLRLMYVSTSSWEMDDKDFHAILEVSRRNNREHGITGMLLHLDHCFLQVLEGPEDAVRSILASVMEDDRHHGVRVLLQQQADERLFSDWSMGFDRPTAERSADVFEITREAIQTSVPHDKAAEIAILLRNFYQVNAGS